MKSLRWRLVTTILAVLSLVVGVGGWATHSLVRAKLFEEFDRDLTERVATLRVFIEKEKGAVVVDWVDDGLTNPPGHRPQAEFVQIWNGAGELVASTPDLGDSQLPKFDGTLQQPVIDPVVLRDGKKGRAAGVAFVVEVDEDDVEKELAEGFDVKSERVAMTLVHIDTVTPMLASLRNLFVLVWLSAALVGGFLIWLNIRSILRPLDSLRHQIGELRKANRRDGRVTLNNPPTELAPVADELNSLIDSLEKALIRERSMTSNVAHELRTPVAGILSTLEVALSRPREADEYREASEDSFEIAKRMHWLVNNLLSMTRIEAGTVEIHNHIVELEPSLKEWWEAFEQRAGELEISIDWKIAPGARLETDPEFLRVVVTNLYDNAVWYTPKGGSITVSADTDGRIAVGNDAVDLSPEAARKVFEPFWREDESRGDVGSHAGLGLALCHKIVNLLGGSIRAAVPSRGERFEVTVDLVSRVRA